MAMYHGRLKNKHHIKCMRSGITKDNTKTYIQVLHNDIYKIL